MKNREREREELTETSQNRCRNKGGHLLHNLEVLEIEEQDNRR